MYQKELSKIDKLVQMDAKAKQIAETAQNNTIIS